MATFLPRLGLNHEQLDAFVNRPETAPAHEAMELLRVARQKEEITGTKTGKESNFDDILGTGTRDASPFEGSSRKRAGPDTSYDPESSKRARMDEPEAGSRLSRYNEYPMHNGGTEQDSGLRPTLDPISTQSQPEASYGAGASNGHSAMSQARGEVTPSRSPNVLANTGQAFMLPEGRAQEAMQLIGYHLTK